MWMSRSITTHQYTLWRSRPEVEWSDEGEPRIGFNLMNANKQVCTMINIHVLFPFLEIPPGEMAEIEVVEMECGYYIGLVE